jgi:ABC-type antimicrobial peptide transport system permease subunit
MQLFVFERSYKMIISVSMAILLFSILAFTFYLCLSIHAMIRAGSLLVFIILTMGYSFVATYFPCKKFIRKDIIDLIKD